MTSTLISQTCNKILVYSYLLKIWSAGLGLATVGIYNIRVTVHRNCGTMEKQEDVRRLSSVPQLGTLTIIFVPNSLSYFFLSSPSLGFHVSTAKGQFKMVTGHLGRVSHNDLTAELYILFKPTTLARSVNWVSRFHASDVQCSLRLSRMRETQCDRTQAGLGSLSWPRGDAQVLSIGGYSHSQRRLCQWATPSTSKHDWQHLYLGHKDTNEDGTLNHWMESSNRQTKNSRYI